VQSNTNKDDAYLKMNSQVLDCNINQ